MALSKIGTNQLDSTATPTFAELDVDNVKVNGNTISSTNTNGDVNIDPNGTGAVAITGGFTATDGCVITTADNSEQLTLVSTDADANVGPILRLNRDSGSPADFDTIGSIVFNADNDASETTEYARLLTFIGDASNGSEDGFIQFDYMIGGTLHNFYKVGGGELVFNEDSKDVNFRVETDGDANMLFVDGGQNRVGIGTGSPQQPFHIKSGNGTLRLHEGAAADNKYAEIEVSNGKLILHSDRANVENSSTMQFHLDNIEYARFIDNGTFLIGTTNGTGDGGGIQLHGNLENGGFINVKKTSSGASGNKFIQFSRDGSEKGSIALNGTNAVQYNTSSDYRLKRDVVDMTDAIDRVKTLLPRRFSWISDPDTTVDGFLAHEAQTVVPEAVSGTHNEVDADGNAVMQGIDQAKLVPLLTAALKESIAKIEALEARVTALEAG